MQSKDEIITTAHAQGRMRQRNIRPEYIAYAFKVGERDEHTQWYQGMSVYKQRCYGLVVVCAAAPGPPAAPVVLTAYWRSGHPELGPFRLSSKAVHHATSGAPSKASVRKQRKYNRSWGFWADKECQCFQCF